MVSQPGALLLLMPTFNSRGHGSGHCWPFDLLFILGAALYAWLAWRGILPISGYGVSLDSDLMTYAQGMAGESHPELFGADPVLAQSSAANSIHNIERALAGWLAPPDQWAQGLLAAGAICIFVFYAAWYILGRWLVGAPSLAAALAIACGTTVWVGWGTFWGIAHSDPLPRVFFGALMPALVYVCMLAMRRAWLRPACMGLAGLFMWVHGVSALNCGAMFFMAFALVRPPGAKFGAQLVNLCFCLIAFFAPVLIFLGASLWQPDGMTPEKLAVFRELMDLRWHTDYSGFGQRMATFFSPFSDAFPVLAGGVAGWLVTLWKGRSRARLFCKMCPCFVLALMCVAAFCWAETHFSLEYGRLPMGHELVRGLRFLVPLSWICIMLGIASVAGRWLRRASLIVVIVCALIIPADRQYMAAQYALSQYTGLSLPLTAKGKEEAARAARLREFLMHVQKLVPQGEAIYSPEDAMQARYIALRPLAHSFKDGYAHFYNKDYEGSARWLKLEKMARSGPDGWLAAWEESGAPWLIGPEKIIGVNMEKLPGRIMLKEDGWILARRN